MLLADRVIGQSTVVGNDKIGLVATDTYELWIFNDTDEAVTLNARHGSLCCQSRRLGDRFQPLIVVRHDHDPTPTCSTNCFALAGTARSEGEKYIPWILNKDTDVVIQITESGKSPTCISEMACAATQRQGLTEMSLVDHSLKQRVQDLIESVGTCCMYLGGFVYAL